MNVIRPLVVFHSIIILGNIIGNNIIIYLIIKCSKNISIGKVPEKYCYVDKRVLGILYLA
jgi:hypothetical protein